MARRVLPKLVALSTLAVLAGCSPFQREERPPWRAQAEQACLAAGRVHEGAGLVSSRPIEGPGICGLTHPFKVTALADGSVTLNSTATLDCPMIAELDSWIRDVVQPSAQARFGEKVVEIKSMGTYACRGINNMSGAKLSEHAFGNAIDIGGFVLASGREISVMRGFNSADEQERAFLHEAHAGACGHFTTVLGPGYNAFHYNHFHFDLAMHGATSRGPRRYCKPVPETSQPEPPRRDLLPDPPAIEEELDIARAPIPGPSLGTEGPTFVATAGPGDMTQVPRPRPLAVAPPPRAPLPQAEPQADPALAEASPEPDALPEAAPVAAPPPRSPPGVLAAPLARPPAPLARAPAPSAPAGEPAIRPVAILPPVRSQGLISFAEPGPRVAPARDIPPQPIRLAPPRRAPSAATLPAAALPTGADTDLMQAGTTQTDPTQDYSARAEPAPPRPRAVVRARPAPMADAGEASGPAEDGVPSDWDLPPRRRTR